MIQVSNLSKWYGSFQALRDVSFRVDEGEIVGLLGPNGAGKTTMIKILTGYLHPDEGTALIGGMDILTRTREVQAIIGYLPENAPLYPELSVQGYLKMIADLRQISPDEQPERIAEAVHAVGLEDQLTRPIGQLSKGYRQRVGLAQAILHRPRILILDEPTLGLDPTQLLEARRLIRRLAGDSTILFSTHILSEVEALCNRVIILMNGEVRADARLSELASSPDAIIVLESVPAGLENSLRSLPGVRTLEPFRSPDGYPAFRVRGGAAHSANLCPAIYRLARQENWPVRELRRDVRTLETVFNQLVATA